MDQWDAKRQIVKRHDNAAEINAYLAGVIKKANSWYLQQLDSGRVIDVKELSEVFVLDTTSNNLLDFIQQNISASSSKPSTIKQHKILLGLLRDFKRDIPFGSVDYQFLKKFEVYLKGCTKKRGGGNFSPNYIASLFAILRIHINEAVRQEKLQYSPFSVFQIQKKPTEHVWLTKDEVKLIEELEIPAPKYRRSLAPAKTLFLFSCYTGLRYSDLKTLQVRHLEETDEGFRLKKKLIKTRDSSGVTVNLPLWKMFGGKPNKMVTAINYEDAQPDWPVFYPLDNSDYNKHLKTIAKMAGIDKRLTTHVGRHTAAMNLLNDGVPVESVAKILGHTDIKTTQIYAQTLDRTVDLHLDRTYNNSK